MINKKKDSRKDTEQKIDGSELAKRIIYGDAFAFEKLPEKCKLIFYMSKYDNLKYSEIAEIQDFSIRTVASHIVRALKFLRERIFKFFPVFLFYFFCKDI